MFMAVRFCGRTINATRCVYRPSNTLLYPDRYTIIRAMTKPKVDAVQTLGQQMSVVRKEYKNLVARKPDANKPSFTIQMLADRLGIDPRVVQRALAETLDLARKFDIPTLMQTAAALGVSLTYAAVIAARDCLVKKAE